MSIECKHICINQLAHGMGDSCFNGGMTEITKDVGTHIGTYSVCVPTGDNWLSDTINGFLLQMDKSVDVFAKKIKANPKLANGFNAIGFSQGNSLIRGYVQKYNDPPINFVLHVHGTVSGVAGFPQCDPTGSFCKGVAHLCGSLAYNSLVQGILFQADYFRDPTKVNSTAYKTYSQLARWNNEGLSLNKQINANFAKTNKFVIIWLKHLAITWYSRTRESGGAISKMVTKHERNGVVYIRFIWPENCK